MQCVYNNDGKDDTEEHIDTKTKRDNINAKGEISSNDNEDKVVYRGG